MAVRPMTASELGLKHLSAPDQPHTAEPAARGARNMVAVTGDLERIATDIDLMYRSEGPANPMALHDGREPQAALAAPIAAAVPKAVCQRLHLSATRACLTSADGDISPQGILEVSIEL